MDRILENFLEIIGNFIDAYTVAFFEIKDDYLILKYSFSLSNYLEKHNKIKIGESIIGWIAKHKRPVNIKGDKVSHKILEIYNKDEDIKTYLVLPVDNKGVLYVDSKRSYSITEKNQKILFYCTKFFSKLIDIKLKQSELKELQKLQEFLKKIDYKNFLNYISNFFKFEGGIIFRKEGENFIVISSNFQLFPIDSKILNSKIEVLLKKNIFKVTFLKSNINKNGIKNCVIIPVNSQNITVGGIILFNNTTEFNEKKLKYELEFVRKVFELKFYEEVFKYEAFKKYHKILTIEKFLSKRKEYENYYKKSFILFKIKNYFRLINKFNDQLIFKSIENLLTTLEQAFNTSFNIVKISPNFFSIIVEPSLLKKIKNFIEKNFKNTYLKVNDHQIKINLDIYSFNNFEDFIKFIFS